MAHDPELAEEMRAALHRRPGITERRMFGGPCWFLNGNLLCGARVGRYLLRVGPELEAQAVAQFGAQRMREETGRGMRGIVWVDAGMASEVGLHTCLALALKFVGGLPPK